MPKQIVIAEQLRIAALLNDEKVEELIVAQGRYQIGDIYLGTVENVLPGIDAAFVNIGESEKNGFIHVTDLGPLRLKKGTLGITELLEPKQKVLVQVIKEPTGSKGPRLTGNIGLPGRYLVLQPNSQGVNIARKISSEGERNRLRALGVLVKPPGSGLLIRTEANGISEELLIDDLENLLKQWEAIQQAAESSIPPVLLNRDEDFIHRVLRDHIDPQVSKVIVENSLAVERVNQFLMQNEENISVESHREPNLLLNHFKINSAIQDALRPRVDLPSGGYIIIEPTEALTVIDVNSGSFTRSANSRETVLWTNCEAAVEIARQLKLRNIGGVIIIDFIDMESRKDQLQLLEHFTNSVKNDSARPQIAQLTELGLVELTRKRQGQNIYELFGQCCPNCYGLGHIAVLPGENILEPMASASGLVKTGDLNKLEATENNQNRKKKILKNNRSISDVPSHGIAENIISSKDSNPIEEVESIQTLENNQGTNKQEQELIGVKMNIEQQEVYSELGLNPILLLEGNHHTNDNLLIRIAKPEEDIELILEESINQLSANNNKRRRRGRNNQGRLNSKNQNDNNIEQEDEVKNNLLEKDIKKENEQDLQLESLNNLPIPKTEEAIEEISLLEIDSSEEIEDPRRKRRRSSASTNSEQ